MGQHRSRDSRWYRRLPVMATALVVAVTAQFSAADGGLAGAVLASGGLSTGVITSGVVFRSRTCGDGLLGQNELCDPKRALNLTCADLERGSGTLGCDSDCLGFDAAKCSGRPSAVCGNGTVDSSRLQPLEVCDGRDLLRRTCADLGFDGGVLRCDKDCLGYDTSGCYNDVCGDGVAGPSEACDTDDLKAKTCADFGYAGGTLRCTDCAYDTSGCTNHPWILGYLNLNLYTLTTLPLSQIQFTTPTLTSLASVYQPLVGEAALPRADLDLQVLGTDVTLRTVNLDDDLNSELYPVFDTFLQTMAEQGRVPNSFEAMRIPGDASAAGPVILGSVGLANGTTQGVMVFPAAGFLPGTVAGLTTLAGDSGSPMLVLPLSTDLLAGVYLTRLGTTQLTVLDLDTEADLVQQLGENLQVRTEVVNGVRIHSLALLDRTNHRTVIVSRDCHDCHPAGRPQATARTPQARRAAGAGPATLAGTVADTAAHPIAGAMVVAKGLSTTNPDEPMLVAMSMPSPAGAYFALLPAGSYETGAQASGYQSTPFFNLDLAAAASAQRDFALEPAGNGGFSGSVITPQSSGAAQVKETGADPNQSVTLDQDGDGTPDAYDCAPTDPGRHPGAAEVCNGIDDDCNGLVDDGLPFRDYYADNDGDGYGAGSAASLCADPGDGRVPQGGDCDDTDTSLNPATTWYRDVDHDGYSDQVTVQQCARPAGYRLAGELTDPGAVDCDDTNALVHPGADDGDCDNVDDDCDGVPDDGYIPTAITCGVGGCQATGSRTCVAGSLVDACTPGSPAAEICGNDFDEDCNGHDLACSDADTDGDGYTPAEGDCDDTNATIHPGALEICDTKDNDCDAATVDGSGEAWFGTATTCGTGGCAATGSWTCATGVKTDTCTPGPPATETCNNVDDDCNGLVDDGLVFRDYYVDNDGDGYGAGSAESLCADPGDGRVTRGGDCDDHDNAVHPGAPEICDTKDNDCDAATVDGSGESWFGTATTCGTGGCAATGSWTCATGVKTDTCTPGAPAAETCNNVDDDCNGLVDDGLAFVAYYADNDHDGYGAGSGESLCADPGDGRVSRGGDCDDTDTFLNPATTWYRDVDHDGYTDQVTVVQCTRPLGYRLATELTDKVAVDCDDTDPGVHPGARDDDCDGVDDDCDGVADDGYVPTATTCGTGPCQATGSLTCDGGRLVDSCLPGPPAAEVCGNTIDEDCNGHDLDCATVDSDGDGYTPAAGDCDDSDGAIHPGAAELCDGRDNDCDANTADGSDETWYQRRTTCGVGACGGEGRLVCVAGAQEDTCVAGTPSAEICDGRDNDCDGQVDEGLAYLDYFEDSDGDGYGAGPPQSSCADPDNGRVATGNDCNDDDPRVHPANPMAGDVDGDGRVTLADGVLLARHGAGLATPALCPFADGDGDGVLGLAELLGVLEVLSR